MLEVREHWFAGSQTNACICQTCKCIPGEGKRSLQKSRTHSHIDAALNNQSLAENQEQRDYLQVTVLFSTLMVLGELGMHREVIDTVDELVDLYANVQYRDLEESQEEVVIDEELVLEARLQKARRPKRT